MKIIKFLPLISLLILVACASPPDYPIEPEIEFFSLSKNTMNQGFSELDDFLTLTLSFTDGDGDLGNENNQPNIFFTDTRTDQQDLSLTSAPVPDQGTGNGISGKIHIKVPTTCCFYPPINNFICNDPIQDWPIDTLIYTVQIRDRAGNLSNSVECDPIYLICF